jgi:single-strand DNA-binding protein
MSPLRMPQLNEVMVAGRLCSDPDISTTSGGTQRGYVRLAVNRSYRRNDEWEEETCFFSIVAWAGVAERLEQLKKGSPVIVQGRLRSYDPPQDDDGTRKPSVVEITAQRIQHVTYTPDGANADDQGVVPPPSADDDHPL